MTLMRKTSYSEVQEFLKCGRAHYYSYGLELRGKFMPEALERGIIAHDALAVYYSARMGGASHDDSVVVAMARLADHIQTTEAYSGQAIVMEVASLLRLYFANYADDPIEVLAVETEYSIGILEDYALPVRIDVILRNLRTGRTAAFDHKVVKDFYDEKKIRIMPQMRLYKAGLMTEGIQVDDLVYNQLRHRNTLDNKADPSQRFVRVSIPANALSIRRTIEEHLVAGNRIKAWRSLPIEEWERKTLRNTLACNMCAFTELCAQDLEGEDTSSLIEFEYRKKTKRSDMNA